MPLNESLDQPIWILNLSGTFSVGSRIAFFAQEAGHGCTLTIDKLVRRRKILVKRCCLCRRAEETCDHILLWCPLCIILGAWPRRRLFLTLFQSPWALDLCFEVIKVSSQLLPLLVGHVCLSLRCQGVIIVFPLFAGGGWLLVEIPTFVLCMLRFSAEGRLKVIHALSANGYWIILTQLLRLLAWFGVFSCHC